MILCNGDNPVKISLSDGLIDMNCIGIYNLNNSINYFIGIDLMKCSQQNNKLYQILKLLCMQDLNVPEYFIDFVLSSSQNEFKISINIEVKSNPAYKIVIAGMVGENGFKLIFDCQPNLLDKMLISKYINIVKKQSINKNTI